jgi:hemerythrin-like metal-binding protein
MFSEFRIYKPKWLYEILPYIYIASGILTIISMWNAMGMFSGCMLILAGLIVWNWRKNYRKTSPAIDQTDENKNKSGLIHIVWRKSFQSGHKEIDDQHRMLFTDANKLIDAITNRESSLLINETMRELIKNIQTHFKTEEALLAKIAPEIIEMHKPMHDQLLHEIRAIADRVYRNELSPRELIGFIVYDVITNHLAKEDTKFFQLLN